MKDWKSLKEEWNELGRKPPCSHKLEAIILLSAYQWNDPFSRKCFPAGTWVWCHITTSHSRLREAWQWGRTLFTQGHKMEIFNCLWNTDSNQNMWARQASWTGFCRSGCYPTSLHGRLAQHAAAPHLCGSYWLPAYAQRKQQMFWEHTLLPPTWEWFLAPGFGLVHPRPLRPSVWSVRGWKNLSTSVRLSYK